MEEFYSFDFLQTVTEQLSKLLLSITPSTLNAEGLARIAAFQESHDTAHGVYLLYYQGVPVYAGKAENVRARLGKHFKKASGRPLIDLEQFAYKAILLDPSMSTAANETLLIRYFKALNQCEWNGSGFGPNDPGKERDSSEPNWFDSHFPVPLEHEVPNVEDVETVYSLLLKMKKALPFNFRWDRENLSAQDRKILVQLAGASRSGSELAKALVGVLGPDWQAVGFPSHMILYKTNRTFVYGTRLA